MEILFQLESHGIHFQVESHGVRFQWLPFFLYVTGSVQLQLDTPWFPLQSHSFAIFYAMACSDPYFIF